MLHPGDRIGDWEIVLPLGQGGMGSVYRCRHALSARIEAAVKVLKPTDRAGSRERFIREAEALHSLRHPAIVRIAGFGQDADTGLMWIAMELVHGDTFERLIQRGGFPRERLARVFGPVAEGLAYAHSRGIVHRDIKPGNLMLQSDGTPVLLDFGIAVQEGQDRLTREGVIPGTVAYAAPEQVVAGAQSDPAQADVYALGQVMCECLTGSFTYPRRAGMDAHKRAVRILRAKLKAEPLDPGEGYARRVRELIRTATEPDPARRGPPLQEWGSALGTAPIMEEETATLVSGSLVPSSSGPPSSEPPAAAGPPSSSPPPSPAGRASSAGRPSTARSAGEASTARAPASGLPLDVSLPPAPDATPSLHTDETAIGGRRGAGLWIGLTAAVVVLLGGLLLGVTAVGGAAAWWSLASTPPPAPPDVPLGDVLQVDEAGEPPPPATAPTPPVDPAPVAPPLTVAERPARARTTPAGSGRLVIASEPSSSVHVDGELTRRTPLGLDVPAGRHAVELVTDDGRSKRFTVVVDPSEKVRRMWSFDLGEWRSFEGGIDEAGLPTRPANVREASTLLRALPDTGACLEAAGAEEVVTVTFTVAPDGSVVAEGVREAAHRGTALEACLQQASRKLRFGPSVAGAAISVRVGD